MRREKVDLHIHSCYSDGTCTPQQIFAWARYTGVKHCSITDHDTLAGIDEAMRCDLFDLHFISGAEISCSDGDYNYHILGYNFDIEKMRDIIEEGNRLGRQKIKDMIRYVDEECGFILLEKEIEELLKKPSPRKPDLAKVMLKAGYGIDMESIIQHTLNEFPSNKSYRLKVNEVIQAIHEAGGLAVWAHPFRARGNRMMDKEEFLLRFQNIGSLIDGLEVFYSQFTKEQYEFLEGFAKGKNLLISCGSDFHGKNKEYVSFGQVNLENEEIDISRITILDKLL